MSKKKFSPNAVFFTILIVCFCVISVIAIGQRGTDYGKPATELVAKLVLYKNQYLLREPIWVKMKVTNIGKEEGWFYFCTRGCLKIKDSKGKEYPSHVSSSLSPVTIKPGETLEYELNLLGCFGIPENKFKIRYYLPPEKYTIGYELGKDIKSETYKFEIIQPRGDELKAMNLLKESYELLVQKKWNLQIEKLNEIIKNFSNSAYASKAYFEKSLIYGISIRDFDKKMNTLYELLNNHPNSREAVYGLPKIVENFLNKKDENECLKYLNDLIEKYPNTDIATEAEKQLRKIKERDLE